MDLLTRSAHHLSCMLRSREISSEELVRACLDQIGRKDQEVRAFLHVAGEAALGEAREVDRLRGAGVPLHDLAGIPVAIKDNICVMGAPTTAGSQMLEGVVSPYEATVVERIRSARMVIIGKTNLDEFAMGSSTENSHWGPTRNPWQIDRAPGGSSGGSAAAVACHEAPLALGSDTGGSIRQPASFCGVVGFKPTYGLVSRYGLIAFASSLDQIGPFARRVQDAAALTELIACPDERDATCARSERPRLAEGLDQGIEGLVVGVPKEYFTQGIHPDVERAIHKSISDLASVGARIEEISLPHTEYAIATYYLIATAEASANLARYDGVQYGHRASAYRDLVDMYCQTRREGFGAEVKRRIMLGTYALSAGYYDAYYLKALKVRALIRRDFEEAFTRCDLLVTPSTPTPAFRLGEKTSDPVGMYLSDVYTVSVNLAGLPAISVPVELSSEGLPIGLQIIGRAFDERTVFRAAQAAETLSGFPGHEAPKP